MKDTEALKKKLAEHRKAKRIAIDLALEAKSKIDLADWWREAANECAAEVEILLALGMPSFHAVVQKKALEDKADKAHADWANDYATRLLRAHGILAMNVVSNEVTTSFTIVTESEVTRLLSKLRGKQDFNMSSLKNGSAGYRVTITGTIGEIITKL